jgi:hypothetical protein
VVSDVYIHRYGSKLGVGSSPCALSAWTWVLTVLQHGRWRLSGAETSTLLEWLVEKSVGVNSPRLMDDD